LSPWQPPKRRDARVAGLWYLLLAVAGVFAYQYVPTLVVQGDPGATASSIMAHISVVRLGIVAELVEAVLSIFLVRALYRLLSGVDKANATLMVTLVLVAVPIAFVVALTEVATLMLYGGAGLAPAFTPAQLDALALTLLDVHAQGLYIASVFWGLWLFPFGLLVYRSGFFPRVLGLLLFANGFAYLAISLVSLLVPSYSGEVTEALFLPEALGELSTMVWLLVKGTSSNGSNAS
jgi:hypothetical protein